MKMLKKLALVSAVSMISAGAFAMEAMDEESMAATTGQDGITILVKPGVLTDTQVANMGVTQATRDLIDNATTGYYANSDDTFAGLSIGTIVVHDDDGLGASTAGGTGTGNSGALVIGGGATGANAAAILADRTVLVADGSSPIKIEIDMVGDSNGTSAGGGAMLNVKISTPRLGIKTGDIYVANSNAAEAGRDADGTTNAAALEVDGTTHSGKIKIMSGLELVIGAAATTIQLGSEAQGHMIVSNTSLIGGLTINNLEVFDAGGTVGALGSVVTTGGSLFAKSLSIKDAGGSNLSVISNVDIGSVSTATYSGVALTDVTANVAAAYSAPVLGTLLLNGQSAGYGIAATAGLTGTYTSYVQLATLAAGGNATAIADKALVDADVGTNLAGFQSTVLSATQTATQTAYNGLVVEMAQFGDVNNGADVSINNIRIGDATSATLGSA